MHTNRSLEPLHRTEQINPAQPLIPVLEQRWSPRSFDPDFSLDTQQMDALLQAARWAPSASNQQPWRFVLGLRGGRVFEQLEQSMIGFNRVWAPQASALLLGIADHTDDAGSPQRWAEFDLGQAFGLLSVQAHAVGLHVHQIGGFDAAQLSEAFNLREGRVPVTIMAIGRRAEPGRLPESHQSMEGVGRARHSLEALVLRSDS